MRQAELHLELKESLIADYQFKIESAIRNELDRYKNSPFYGSLSYALAGGKRVRPFILLLCAESVGRIQADPLPAAIAVELLHTESIIHDDILDQEISRRDKLTFHVRYGLGASILSADFVFGIILDIASRYVDPRIARELSSASLRMCEGEFEELKIDPELYNLKWNDYIYLISQKTASLFQTSSRIGGIIGGGNEKEIEAISTYGLCLGIAYQIRDDFLDWENDKKAIEVSEIETKMPLLSYLKEMSGFYSEAAKKSLAILAESEAKKSLLELADFTITRNM